MVLCYLPKLLTLYGGRWFLGETICFITAFLQFIPGTVEVLNLTAITAYRFNIINNPLKSHPKLKVVKACVLCMWGVAIINPVIFIASGKSNAVYDPRNFSCVTDVVLNHKLLVFSSLLLLAIVPMIITIILNCYSLAYVFFFNHNRCCSSHSTAMITVSSICWVFIMSWIPYIVRVGASITHQELPGWFVIVQHDFNILSVTLNPVIYTITDRRFRMFIKRRLMRLKREVKAVYINWVVL